MMKYNKFILLPRFQVSFAFNFLFFCLAICFSCRGQTAVNYVGLNAASGKRDCSEAGPGELCRIKRIPSESELKNALVGETGMWANGDTLNFVYQDKANQVELFGGMSYPLSPIVGTQTWVLSLKVPGLSHAILGIQFFVIQEGKLRLVPDKPLSVINYHLGVRAEPAPKLRGKLVIDSLYSNNLKSYRKYAVYTPGQGKTNRILYMADGEYLEDYASVIDTLINTKVLPPMVIVGVYNGKRGIGNDPRSADTRAMEYLNGFGYSDSSFLNHEQFLIRELVPFIEARYLPNLKPKRRAIFGASNGGSFATAMGIRHPELFGHVINFSGAWKGNLEMPFGVGPSPSFYLMAGTLEIERVKVQMKSFYDAHRKNGNLNFITPVAGHDSFAWTRLLPEALLWSWKR